MWSILHELQVGIHALRQFVAGLDETVDVVERHVEGVHGEVRDEDGAVTAQEQVAADQHGEGENLAADVQFGHEIE